MANGLDLMDIKQIISLKKDGLSNRNIGKLLGISRNTVNTYNKLIQASDYELEELMEMDASALRDLFPSHTTIINERYNALMLFFERMQAHKNHRGFTIKYHYLEYQQQESDPYSYTQFAEHFNRKYAHIKGSMKLDHKPGHELFIDYAGEKLHITDRETGELIPVEVFVAILPNSHYTYVEACMSQKREDLIGCTANALGYFGGVPKAIVSDNLKAAVSRASKYEPEINRTFKDFALHYGCAINPTRGYAPQDKALVENAVQLAYQRIYYPIREMTFFSLKDLNREIQRLLGPYNDLLLQRKEASRRELFQSVERCCLKPLPETLYEIKDYRRAKVQKIGYVYFSPDKTYYSVPYRYIGKTTQVHFTKSIVEVYYNQERIALHKRNPAKGLYNTIPDHLSSHHKDYAEWSPDYFIKKAIPHGGHVTACIKKLFSGNEYPETQYKRAMGIIQLHREYGPKRLDNACQIALDAGTSSYKRIKNILKNKLDKNPFQTKELVEAHIPSHENLRGASAYK